MNNVRSDRFDSRCKDVALNGHWVDTTSFGSMIFLALSWRAGIFETWSQR